VTLTFDDPASPDWSTAMKTIETATPHPTVCSREDWLIERLRLLEHEKRNTHQRDRVNAERRRLPMVKIEKDYRFQGPKGKVGLADLFDGKRQLIVYHFMFDPKWDRGCPGCTGYVDSLGDLSMLRERDTHFVLISRAPLPKLEAYKAERGWDLPWYSSFETDFNYDYHVSLDEKVAPIEYNFKTKNELEAQKAPNPRTGESHGLSVFFQLDDEVFHTYSAYARGVEGLTNAYSLLDTTPYGRQEDFEDSPPGWPQRPTYG
jgi:predicted dithiol-disulfide oxidoreductase (DUF899 family)